MSIGEAEILGQLVLAPVNSKNSAPTFHLLVEKQASGFSLLLIDDRFSLYCLPRKNVVSQPKTWVPGSW